MPGRKEEPSGPTLAGRDSELEVLSEMVDALESTGARTVLVGGEAGIGKTRLVDELLARAQSTGILTAIGVCTPSEGGGLAYGPIVGVVRDLSRRLDGSASGDPLATARRALGLDGDTAGPAPAGETNRVQLVEALLACCRALGERGRAVLVFEDLHWADSTSLEMIDFLARNLGASPILIIATYRSDEIDRVGALASTLTELVRHRAVSHIELTGLDRDAMALLMRDILGAPPDWSLLDAVHARSGGNPFYAEELTAARDAPSLPSALLNVVLLRIERLSADARLLTATIATAGLSIDHRVLSAACALDAARLHTATAEAVAGHLLAIDDGTRLRFRHALQREAVYESLLPTERVRLHHQLAVALGALGALDDQRGQGLGHADGELAYHWWEAGEWAPAMHAARRAGDAMAALLAVPEAYAQYERALAAYDRSNASERADIDYVDLLIKSSDMAYIAGHTARARELVTLAIDTADPAATPERVATALTMFGRQAAVAGDLTAAFAAFDRAAALLPSDRPTRELALVVAHEAGCRMNSGRLPAAATRAREAIELARATGAREAEGHAHCTLGCCLVETGHVDDGIEHVRTAVEIAEDLQLPGLLDRSYGNLAHVLMTAGRLDEAARLVKNPTNGEWVTGIRLYGAGQNSSEALIRAGRHDEACEILDRMPERGTSSCVFGPHALRALLALRQGQLDDADAHLDAAELISADQPEFRVGGTAHMLRAAVLLEREAPDDAYAAIEEALTNVAVTEDHVLRPEICGLGIRALADRYEAARVRGRTVDLDKLRRLAAALVEQAQSDVDTITRPTGATPRVRALLAQCEAEATRLDEPDPDLWRAAVAAWTEASEPWSTSYCQWREAEAALATNARSDAVAATTAAWSRAREIGAPRLVANVERLAQRARIKLVDQSPDAENPQRAVAGDLGLTAREVEVLDQLARGRTDRQIADSLFISKKTASVHVSNILRKLDAGNRVDAGEIGQRAGLGLSPA